MIWLFQRGRDDVRVESLYDNVSGQYVLTLRHPDGSQTVERYPNTETLEARLANLEAVLQTEQWRQSSPAARMKDVWHL